MEISKLYTKEPGDPFNTQMFLKVPEEKRVADLQTILSVSSKLIRERSLDNLLELIVDTAEKLADCERGTIYMIDHEKNEIWSRVMTGDEVKEIRQPVGVGISGKVAETGEIINIPEAYDDPRFNPEWDKKTGYRTKEILCMPMINYDGKHIGAIQLLNKNGGGVFVEYDIMVLSALTSNAAIALNNAVLLEHFIEKQKIEQSLKIAHDIQQGLIPQKAPEFEGYDIACWNTPCDETGGDYYDFILADEDNLGICIGDVSGHGVGSALLMASARAFLRAFAQSIKDPSEIFEKMNNLIEGDTSDEKFMTMWFGYINRKENDIVYSSAGHDEPVIYVAATDEFAELEATGMPLGMLEGMEFPLGGRFILRAGDIIVFMTDGIWEQRNVGEKAYGKERMMDIMREKKDSSAQEILDSVYASVVDFRGYAPQRDDYTIVVVKKL